VPEFHDAQPICFAYKTLRKIQFQKVPAMRFNKWKAKSVGVEGTEIRKYDIPYEHPLGFFYTMDRPI
jgi:hypothetical protein